MRCFILPHPGLEVPKKAFSGEVELIHPFFRRLLNHYAREVFGPELEVRAAHMAIVEGTDGGRQPDGH